MLPFSPTRWQPRQPDDAITFLPRTYWAEVFRSICVGGPASAPSSVRYPIAMMVVMPANMAIGRFSGRRSGLRSMNGSRISSTMQTVGMPTVATNTSAGGLTTRSSSNRKKKYHSGRGV